MKLMQRKKCSERRKHSARAGCSKVRTPPARCHKPTDRTENLIIVARRDEVRESKTTERFITINYKYKETVNVFALFARA